MTLGILDERRHLHPNPPALAPGMTPDYPRVFGAYVLEEMLSRGGMAEIYRARQVGPYGFHKTVALKKILPGLARNEDFRRLFIEEARTVAGLDHPNIVPVHDLGELGGDLYMTMEYMDGFDLKNLLRVAKEKELKLPVELVTHVAASIARALEFAFTRPGEDGCPLEIVHRDVSPPNILLSFTGAVKLTDFGIAKPASYVEIRKSPPQGKPRYISPEQAAGDPVDARSDIFSLGVVLQEMCSEMGPSPFAPALERVGQKATSSSPEQRYADAGEMAAALDLARLEQAAGGATETARFMRIAFGASSRDGVVVS